MVRNTKKSTVRKSVAKRTTAVKQKKTWRDWLKEGDEAAKKGNAASYDVAVAYCKVCEDKEFQKEMFKRGEKGEDFLSNRLSFVNFPTLRTIYKKFPDKKQWEEGNLMEMLEEAMKDVKEKNKKEKKENRVRITKAAYEKLQEENKNLIQELDRLREELKRANKIIDTLSSTVQIEREHFEHSVEHFGHRIGDLSEENSILKSKQQEQDAAA